MGIDSLLEKAFEELKGMLTGYFISNKVKIHDVEDLVNDTFVLAWSYRNGLKDESKVKSWIFSIAKNVLIKYKQELAKKRSGEITIDERSENMLESHHNHYEHDDNLNFALDLINGLPPKYRDVVILFYVDGKSISEISEILGISEDNCKVRLFRARKMIMEALGEENEAQRDN